MTIEASGLTPDQPSNETQRLEALLLSSLVEHDGLCLDDEEERQRLASILASALIAAVKDDAELEALLQEVNSEQKGSRWPEPTIERPDIETLEEWHSEGGCEATDGCWVEPDGVCQHDHPSWLLRLGYI